jgi:hypothetical protein
MLDICLNIMDLKKKKLNSVTKWLVKVLAGETIILERSVVDKKKIN